MYVDKMSTYGKAIHIHKFANYDSKTELGKLLELKSINQSINKKQNTNKQSIYILKCIIKITTQTNNNNNL